MSKARTKYRTRNCLAIHNFKPPRELLQRVKNNNNKFGRRLTAPCLLQTLCTTSSSFGTNLELCLRGPRLIEASVSEPLQKAIFLAAVSPHSGDWLLTLPVSIGVILGGYEGYAYPPLFKVGGTVPPTFKRYKSGYFCLHLVT